jgi:hypothetical protein
LLATDTEPEAAPAAVGVNVTVRVTVWLGVSVVPEVTPLAEKPEPVVVTPEIVMFELPLFVSVTFCVAFEPTLVFANVTVEGLAVSESVAATPVPLNGIESGEPGALLASDRDPLTAPAVVGEKATLNEMFWPAVIVTGVVSPEVLKPAPVTVADEIVREAVPPFVIFTGVVFVLPSVTLPKLTDVGFAEICGCVPVPLREIVSGEPGALLVTETLPVALPAEVGAN